MLPITPASIYLRSRAFVKEEWDAKFTDGRANTDIGKSPTQSPHSVFLPLVPLSTTFLTTLIYATLTHSHLVGWRGILYANLALINPRASFSFFRDGVAGVWDDDWIDGGGSRTWYLVLAAALMGEGARR
jgi:endo-1,3(4)-beta-glucanase